MMDLAVAFLNNFLVFTSALLGTVVGGYLYSHLMLRKGENTVRKALREARETAEYREAIEALHNLNTLLKNEELHKILVVTSTFLDKLLNPPEPQENPDAIPVKNLGGDVQRRGI